MKIFTSFNKEDYRRRIRLLRKLYGMNQMQWSVFTGIRYKKWNHYERGYPIPRETAFILREKIPGISTDWIWFGATAGVESGLLDRLMRLERDEVKYGEPKIGEQERTRRIRKVRRRISKTDIKKRNSNHKK